MALSSEERAVLQIVAEIDSALDSFREAQARWDSALREMQVASDQADLDKGFQRADAAATDMVAASKRASSGLRDLSADGRLSEERMQGLAAAVGSVDSEASQATDSLARMRGELKSGERSADGLGEKLNDVGEQAGAARGRAIDLADAIKLRFPQIASGVLAGASAVLVFREAWEQTRNVIGFVKEELGVDIDAIVSDTLRLREAADALAGATRSDADEARLLANERRILINLGKDFVDSEDGIREAYARTTGELRQQRDELLAAVSALDKLRGFKAGDVQDEIAGLSTVLAQLRPALETNSSLFEDFQRGVAHAGERLKALRDDEAGPETRQRFAELAQAVRDLEAAQQADADTSAAQADELRKLAVETQRFKEAVAGSSEELDRRATAIEEGIAQLEAEGGVTEQAAAKVAEAIRELLEEFGSFGIEAPESLRRLAREFPVVEGAAKSAKGAVGETADEVDRLGTSAAQAAGDEGLSLLGRSIAEVAQELAGLKEAARGPREVARDAVGLRQRIEELGSKTTLTADETNELADAQAQLAHVEGELRTSIGAAAAAQEEALATTRQLGEASDGAASLVEGLGVVIDETSGRVADARDQVDTFIPGIGAMGQGALAAAKGLGEANEQLDRFGQQKKQAEDLAAAWKKAGDESERAAARTVKALGEIAEALVDPLAKCQQLAECVRSIGR